MTALGGFWDIRSNVPAHAACTKVLAALAVYGGADRSLKSSGPVAVGRALSLVLAEDSFDDQPYAGPDGSLFVAEGRIDNRLEIGESLAIPDRDLARMPDSRVLKLAWRKWGLRTFDHVLGDVALAAWDAGARTLALARGPFSTRTLFFVVDPKFVAFASMPQALFAVPGVRRAPDFDHCARILARRHFLGHSTIFTGVHAVPSNRAVIFAQGRPHHEHMLWEPSLRPLPRNELAEALRHELDRAVAAQLRRRSGAVACHLSAGRDSGAVATSAAVLLRSTNEQLIALTGAPRTGFQEAVPSRFVDEVPLAALTAGTHPTMRHVICRSPPVKVGPMLDELHRFHFGPMLNPSNAPWWTMVGRAAGQHGASVLLNATCGNFSVSSGGQNALLEILRDGSVGEFVRSIRTIARRSEGGWRTVGTLVLGPFVPRPIYKMFRSATGRSDRRYFDLPVLNQPWRGRAELGRRADFDPRPSGDFREDLRDSLINYESGERLSSILYGLDVRDPTSDRRLVEFCYSLPGDALYSSKSDRPVYEAAFRDRIPAETLRNPVRAYQQADWFEVFRPDDVLETLRAYARNPLVAELFDISAIEELIARWPSDATWMQDAQRFRNMSEDYRYKVLLSLSIASFLNLHFRSA